LRKALEPSQLLKLSASKAGSKSTLRVLKAAVLSILASIPSRVSSSRNWLASNPQKSVQEVDIVQFSRQLYKLLNSSASVSNPFSTFTLRTLLLSIGGDCLLFFTGIWSDPTFGNLRVIALRHGQAFVQAHVDSQSKRATKDFQIVWPFVLAVLTEESQELRDTAVGFVNTMYAAVKGDEDNKKAAGPDIYGLDGLPPEVKSWYYTFCSRLVTHDSSPDNLKFLEWPDFVKLVATVAAWTEHLKVDTTYLTQLLKSTLQIQSGDSSKDAKCKRRLLSYLLSHVMAWSASCPLPPIKILQEIHDVDDPMKLQVLLPLLGALAKSPSIVLERLSVNHREAYVSGLLSSFQGREVGSFMNAESSEEWETLKELARIGLRDGKWVCIGYEPTSHLLWIDRSHRDVVPPCVNTLCVWCLEGISPS
jgi:U3 small nucleolar RNA-associated protein 10